MKDSTSTIAGFVALWMFSACGGGGASGSVDSASAGGTSSVGVPDASGAPAEGVCSGSGGASGAPMDGGLGAPIVITSAEGSYWQQGQPIEVADGKADVTVNDCLEAQTWEGFGGCFTELGWVYLSTLSQTDRDEAIRLLFGPDGARFAWARVPIGGNDYVLGHYTLDDTGDDVVPDAAETNRPPADPALDSFSIARDMNYLIPFIKAAQAVKPDLRFWAVPWTPPVWMKTGYTADDGAGGVAKRASYYEGGSMKGDDATLAAHARYFVSFVQAYQAQGIHVEMVAPQNEPGAQHTYPSCQWDKNTYVTFIGKHLGPALRGAGLDTKVMLGGSFDIRSDVDFVEAVLADPTAKSFCAVAGLGYEMVSPSNTSAIKSAGLPIWVSEHKAGNYPWKADYSEIAPNDLAYAIESWGLVRTAITSVGVSAYNAWHMVLDKAGKNIDVSSPWAQDSLLVADGEQLIPTPVYYVFRHLSRFVAPGAKVVGTSGGDAVAFKNPDGSLVVVLYHSGSAKTMTVAIGGKKLQFQAPGKGFVTLVKP